MTQKDLPDGAKSGLDDALRVLKGIDEIGVCMLTSQDVVRHPLVQKIVSLMTRMRNAGRPEVRRGRRTSTEEMRRDGTEGSDAGDKRRGIRQSGMDKDAAESKETAKSRDAAKRRLR